MIKHVIVIGILIFSFFKSPAQIDITELTSQFNSYQQVWPRTKLHLILNQDKFFPGDTVWFKAYFLKEDMTFVSGKQLIDLNLTDSEGKSKHHFIFSVNNGLGQNQFIIPENLSSGIYLLTAHSNWMKNFDPSFIFRKRILVVNKNQIVTTEKAIFKAEAEGGHFISNVPNKISISTGRPGCSVQIVDIRGNNIGNRITDNNGMTSFIFTPSDTTSYSAKVAGELEQITLPIAEADGCALFLTLPDVGEKSAKVRLTSPPGSSIQNEKLTAIISGQGRIYYTKSAIQARKEYIELSFPVDSLPDGIIHISILNTIGELIASRDFYNPEKETIKAKVEIPNKTFQPREKITAEIILTNKGEPVEGEFTIRVSNAGLFEQEKQNLLFDDLNVECWNKEKPFINRSDPDWMKSLDNYLICFHSIIPWKKILTKDITRPVFAFNTAIQKTGTAYFGDTHEPLPYFTKILFYLQKNTLHYQTFTQEEGKVSLAIPDIYDEDEFFYLAELKGKDVTGVKIEWEELPIALPSAPPSNETQTPDVYASFIIKDRLIEQSFSPYTSENLLSGKEDVRKNDLEEQIGGADITLNVQDYILFPTMEELVKEITSSIYHRKTGKKNSVRVKLVQPMIANADPLYIVDGIATKNTDFFLSIKPSDLITLKIVKTPKKLLPLGLLGKNGIIIAKTKKGNLREPVDPSKLIEGISRPVHFKLSDYSSEMDRYKPNFRSTIYWNPSVKINSDGKTAIEFFCSDDVGKLNIRIDGMAAGNKPFSAVQNINVIAKSDKN